MAKVEDVDGVGEPEIDADMEALAVEVIEDETDVDGVCDIA